MSLDIYGIYLDGLALTNQEKIDLINAMNVIAENIINDLFKRNVPHGYDQRKTT